MVFGEDSPFYVDATPKNVLIFHEKVIIQISKKNADMRMRKKVFLRERKRIVAIEYFKTIYHWKKMYFLLSVFE